MKKGKTVRTDGDGPYSINQYTFDTVDKCSAE